jgi:hypothetical protein
MAECRIQEAPYQRVRGTRFVTEPAAIFEIRCPQRLTRGNLIALRVAGEEALRAW